MAGAIAFARPESLGSEHDSLTPLIASTAGGGDGAEPSATKEHDSPERMERKVSYGSGGYGNIRMLHSSHGSKAPSCRQGISPPTSAMRPAQQREQLVLTSVSKKGRPSDHSPWFSPVHSALLHKLVHGIAWTVKSGT